MQLDFLAVRNGSYATQILQSQLVPRGTLTR
jgi:hypothetical protein